MSTRARYQFGCLTRRKRIRTEDVWQFRFYETTAEGRRCRRSRMIGTVVEYPTRADALRMVERFRLRLNLEHRFAQPPKTKVNLRSLFHLVYQHGRRWELTDANPIDLVRQRGGRRRIPRTLDVKEVRLVLEQLAEPYRTMVAVAVCLGLRASEIVGLQWGDFEWAELMLLVKRSVVHGRVGETKTEVSQLPLPVDPGLAEVLQEQRKRSPHQGRQDWVFPNRAGRPLWPESILERQLKPAAVRAGVGKIGWHTFRHSYSKMLRAAHVDLKVQQELLRHATIQSTLNVYTQAVSDEKRQANRWVVRSVLRSETGGSSTESRPTNGTQWVPIATLSEAQEEPEVVGAVEVEIGCGGWI